MKKILVVGYGSIGKRHVENLLSISNLEIIVCTKRNDVKKLKKHAKVYRTLKQCLKEKPDMGIIAMKQVYMLLLQLNWQTKDWIYF